VENWITRDKFLLLGKQGRSQGNDTNDPTGKEKTIKGREKEFNSTCEAM
jgi:hypothetical protein